MSVHRSRRKVAFTEFERQMISLCRHTDERLRSLPSRYRVYLYPRIYGPVNKAMYHTVLAREVSIKRGDGMRQRIALIDLAIESLREMQKPLMSLWNLIDISESGCEYWVDMVNREFALLYGVARKEGKIPMFFALPKRKMERIVFLKKMSDLHKYTYMKLGHAPEYTREHIGRLISEHIDAALFNVMAGNRIIPTTKAEALARERKFNAAIDSLNALQVPLLSLWNIMDYSEATMDEWSGLLDEELRLLEGLKKADRERYKDLR